MSTIEVIENGKVIVESVVAFEPEVVEVHVGRPGVPGPPGTTTNQPRARVSRQGAGLDCVNAVTTKILFDTVEYDTGGLWDAANNAFKIPSGQGGIYHINMTLACPGAAGSTWRWLRLFRNASAFTGHDVTAPSSGTGEGTSLNWSDDLLCTAGASYTMNFWHKHSATIANVKGTFSIRKVGDTPTTTKDVPHELVEVY